MQKGKLRTGGRVHLYNGICSEWNSRDCPEKHHGGGQSIGLLGLPVRPYSGL